jgi:2-polyprenyl-3-methyl-5-hydroxy-6-metoxy-1,4-benzoquinol methylase
MTLLNENDLLDSPHTSNKKLIKQKPDGYYSGIRNDMVPLLPSDYDKVLEIGCGDGGFRKCLKQANEYWGIDPDLDSTNIAKTVLDNVLVGTYEQVCPLLPDYYFDLVICCDVIEHMEHPDLFLQSISKKLKRTKSFLITSIPNVRYLTNLIELLIWKDWRYRNSGILDYTHLRFFTKKSAIRLLNNNGFKIEEVKGLNPIGYKHGFPFNLLQFIIRSDIKYLQFGFRVIPKHQL